MQKVEVLTQTQFGVTYAWFCPSCLAENISETVAQDDIIHCHNCSLTLSMKSGQWELTDNLNHSGS